MLQLLNHTNTKELKIYLIFSWPKLLSSLILVRPIQTIYFKGIKKRIFCVYLSIKLATLLFICYFSKLITLQCVPFEVVQWNQSAIFMDIFSFGFHTQSVAYWHITADYWLTMLTTTGADGLTTFQLYFILVIGAQSPWIWHHCHLWTLS